MTPDSMDHQGSVGWQNQANDWLCQFFVDYYPEAGSENN